MNRMEAYTFWDKIKRYLSEGWNILDILGCSLFFTAFTLKILFGSHSVKVIIWAR